MNSDLTTIDLDKKLLIQKTLNQTDNKKIFDHYDYLLVSKCFNLAQELSLTENILTLSVLKLKIKDIEKIINDFIEAPITSNFADKRCIYEVVKASNRLPVKIEKVLPERNIIDLLGKLSLVLNETSLFSIDFVILRIVDNFILKIKKATIKNQFNALKKDVFRKFLTFKYGVENKEKTTTYFCWSDRFLTAILKNEITLQDFIILNNKILSIVPNNMDICWKILNSVKYLCFQPGYNDIASLRKFKRDLIKVIDEKYNFSTFNIKKTEDILISTLADQTTKKEAFYYLFDIINFQAQQSEDDKKFCLLLCEYLIYRNKKQNIFSYRFIREYFLNILFNLIKEEDSTDLKEQEFVILLKIFHSVQFFNINRCEIFEKIVYILSQLEKSIIRRNRFYKFCDIVDYIIAHNSDLAYTDIINKISNNQKDYSKIRKHFQLFLSVNKF